MQLADLAALVQTFAREELPQPTAMTFASVFTMYLRAFALVLAAAATVAAFLWPLFRRAQRHGPESLLGP